MMQCCLLNSNSVLLHLYTSLPMCGSESTSGRLTVGSDWNKKYFMIFLSSIAAVCVSIAYVIILSYLYFLVCISFSGFWQTEVVTSAF